MEINSINDFKKNFYEIYHHDVLPMLKELESERVKKYNQARFWATLIFLVALGIVIWMYTLNIEGQSLFFIGFLGVMIPGLVYTCFRKDFETKLKKRIMPSLMSAFGHMNWTANRVVDPSEVQNFKIFSYWEYMSTDDNFYGTYKGLPLNISEARLYYETRDSKGRKSTHTIFKGAIITIGVAKSFVGHTIVRKRAFLGNNKCYQEVKLEDPEFSKMFYVDSNDQVEARYVLTTAFMERFKKIRNAFSAEHAECAFKNNKLMLALSTNKDLFALGNFKTPLTNTKPFTEFLTEIISIYEMIDMLKVTEKTGL